MEPISSSKTIAVYGGRGDALSSPDAEVVLYASARFGGAGDVRRLIAALAGGRVDGVVLWARFAGHSVGAHLLEEAHRRGVPTRVVLGGRGAVRRAVKALAGGVA